MLKYSNLSHSAQVVLLLWKPAAAVRARTGQYADGLASRLMLAAIFLMPGGPAIVFPIHKNPPAMRWRPAQRKIRDTALTAHFMYVILPAPGEGQAARACGGVYAMLLFGLTAAFLRRLFV